MKKIRIEIKEYLSKIIEVEATTQEEALIIVKKMYDEEKVILDSSDYVDKNIKVIKDE